jgi:hypothetical protein
MEICFTQRRREERETQRAKPPTSGFLEPDGWLVESIFDAGKALRLSFFSASLREPLSFLAMLGSTAQPV